MNTSTTEPLPSFESLQGLELVLITGTSGAGKSYALHALEDAGYYCVDNLPPALLDALVQLQSTHVLSSHEAMDMRRVAVAIDARSAQGLHSLPAQLTSLRQRGAQVHCVFVDASTETLVRRFAETRRRHPLSAATHTPHGIDAALSALIDHERELLAPLREISTAIDTSGMRSAQLQNWVRQIVQAPSRALTLVLQSFGFKHGVPNDADYVFDVRVLPNPYYDTALRPLCGLDAPVAEFLRQQPATQCMVESIAAFMQQWLDALNTSQRSYVTVAVGCTGGQHRSVYVVEQLRQRWAPTWNTVTRHREMDARATAISL